MKIGKAVYAHSMKTGQEKRRKAKEDAENEETEEVIEEVEVEVDEDGNEINPTEGQTEEL